MNPPPDPRAEPTAAAQRRPAEGRAAAVDAAPPRRVGLSLLAPVHDEEDNLERLHEEVRRVFEDRDDWELVLVDDGSRDGSREVIRRLCERDPRVRGVFLRANCGQSAALAVGFGRARGGVVATMDADLQNDPRDLPELLGLLESSGADAVVGYRQKRRDSVVKRLSSKIANRVRNAISRDSIRDTGCSLKVFRREAIESIAMFDGMHRFLPTLLRYHGFDVREHPVNHRPRVAGVSKYGISNRALRAFVDLLAVRWMRSRILRPVVAETVGRGLDGRAPRHPESSR